MSPESDPPSGPADQQVALAGKDGQQAAALLENTKAAGVRLLSAVTASALARLLRGGGSGLRSARRLYDDREREALAAGFAAALATGDLLGRARIRLRQQQAEALAGVRHFSEDPTDFTAFAEGISPMAPRRAVDFFRSLVPTIGVDPKRYGPQLKRQAFTLSVTTDETVLAKVKGIVARRLETGKGVGTAPAEIQAVLDEAGCTPASSGYASMVFRTNLMDALSTGAMDELQSPEVRTTFPVWRFIGIRDGRQRPSHEVHFDRYYPTSMTFAEVRDSVKGSFDGFACRCSLIPTDRWEWADLYARGVRLAA